MDSIFKNCTLHEALAILEDEDDDNLVPECIFIEPPDPAIHTDEDSADEDQSGMINNLTGNQLNSRCEVVLSTKKKPDDILSDEGGPSLPSPSQSSTYIRGRSRGRARGSRQGRRARGSRQADGSCRSGKRDTRSRSPHVRNNDESDTDTSPCLPSTSRNELVTIQTIRSTLTNQLTESSTDCSESNEVDEPLATTSSNASRTRTWLREDLTETRSVFPEGDYTQFRDKMPTEMLELFFDMDFYDYLVKESQKYAAFINCPDPKITIDEMIAFISILINSGYNKVPSKNHYWDNGDDLRNNLIYNSMRKNRFKTIMRFLHCADNNDINNMDKMWKLRPLINILRSKFSENYVPDQNLNYDESMIEYYGRHGCKQFIRGKPIRFGYKNWCLNTPSGYLLDFEIYQGKSINENSDYDKKFGKATAPLVKMIDTLPPNIQALPMSFYFDNLFTSRELLIELKRRGYDGTGTVRENRLPKDAPVPGKHIMMKKERGHFEYAKNMEDNIIAVKWKDNAVVTVMSTLHGVEPLTNVGRYSRSEKKKVQVIRPAVLTSYNKYMGGTDLMDQNVNTYRIGIRGKKWWWSIFTYLIDVTICNAWVLSKQAGNCIPQLDFRRHIVQTYLMKYRNIPLTAGRHALSKFSISGHRVPDNIRYDGVAHYLIPNAEDKRRRCAYGPCNSQTRSECSKCGVGLCLECNFPFHN